MADVKWVKITTDMFDNRKIKHLRRLPDGNSIVLIWVMLLTMAGRCNSNGMIFLTENIPYTAKMLADELDFEENTVQLALQALERLNMIVIDQGFFMIAGWGEYQNIDGMDKIREQTRIRQARHKAKQKALQGNVIGNVTVTQGNATDIDKEIDRDRDIPPIVPRGDDEVEKVDRISIRFSEFWKAYPKKVGKGAAEKAFGKIKPTQAVFEQIMDAVDRQKHCSQWTRDNGQYIPNPATWLNQRRWEDEPANGNYNSRETNNVFLEIAMEEGIL